MMRKFPVLVLLVSALVAVPGAQQPDKLDYAAIGQIREGLNRSRVMDTLFWLTDLIQQATVAAVFAYNAAMRDEKLPRKALPKPQRPATAAAGR